jgi:hypothetical protein
MRIVSPSALMASLYTISEKSGKLMSYDEKGAASIVMEDILGHSHRRHACRWTLRHRQRREKAPLRRQCVVRQRRQEEAGR